MSAEENKALVRRFIDEVVRKGNAAAADQFIAADFLDHNPFPGQPPGLVGFRQSTTRFASAFPDADITVEDMIAEGDKVVVRQTIRGTHTGEFMGIPPTGKRVTMTGIHIARVAGSKIVENWANWDALGVMRQLGAVPPPR